MDAKHTPGPWRVDETKALGAYGVWTDYEPITGDDGQLYAAQICSVYPANKSDVDRKERDANAKLIAAAPELLDALQGILDDDQVSVSLADQRGRWISRMNEARAAIQKATQ